ncbi:hypothetical protein NL459_27375, partial [Klebsiella pneumoniae]|nr:hypothetical protein [Klebsiella pneumoniae]
ARVAIICDPGMYASGGVQAGEFFQKNANVEQPADCAAGGFYITNAANSFIGEGVGCLLAL